MSLARRAWNLLAVTVVVTVASLMVCSCADDEVCVRNETQACACPTGGTGAQVCSADLQGWEACVCDGGDGDSDGDVDGDVDGDGDADSDGDCDGDVNDLRGTVFFSESEGAIAASASFLPSRAGACGTQRQVFGDCTITTQTGPTCTPACGADELCGWGEGCTPTCHCYQPASPTCEPACEQETQYCSWNADCSAGQCLDLAAPLHAGTITVTGATELSAVTATWNETGYYEWDYGSSTDWWAPGDTLHVEAQGASFPAFSLDLLAPEELEITTDTGEWTLATFDGSADVPVAWTAGTGEVVIDLAPGSMGSHVICTTADDGSFEIPAAALGAAGWELTPGYGVWITFSRRSTTVVNECANGELTGTAGTQVTANVGD